MYLLKSLFAGSAMITCIAAAAPAASATDSEALVSAMAIDKATLLGLNLGIQPGVEKGEFTQSQADCVAETDASVFAAPFVAGFDTHLEADERESAIAFYQSAAGQKYTQQGIYKAYENMGLRSPDPAPDLTDADMEEIGAFYSSPAGTKLLKEQLTNSADIQGPLAEIAQGVVAACVSG